MESSVGAGASPAAPLPADVPEVLGRLSARLAFRARGAQMAASREWAKRFSTWTEDLWGPARAALREPVEPQFDEVSMRATWQEVWCLEGPAVDPEGWRRCADEAEAPLPRSACWWLSGR